MEGGSEEEIGWMRGRGIVRVRWRRKIEKFGQKKKLGVALRLLITTRYGLLVTIKTPNNMGRKFSECGAQEITDRSKLNPRDRHSDNYLSPIPVHYRLEKVEKEKGRLLFEEPVGLRRGKESRAVARLRHHLGVR